MLRRSARSAISIALSKSPTKYVQTALVGPAPSILATVSFGIVQQNSPASMFFWFTPSWSKIMHRILLTTALAMAFVSPAFAQKAEIEALNKKFVEAFNKGDFAAVASLYTKDATVLPPGAAMVLGSTAIEALWKSFGEQGSDPKLTTLDVKELGPSAAREIGTYSLNTKGSPGKELSGKYVVVWEKVGNEWKLSTDIWNDGK